jgi:hypothetical protein
MILQHVAEVLKILGGGALFFSFTEVRNYPDYLQANTHNTHSSLNAHIGQHYHLISAFTYTRVHTHTQFS